MRSPKSRASGIVERVRPFNAIANSYQTHHIHSSAVSPSYSPPHTLTQPSHTPIPNNSTLKHPRHPRRRPLQIHPLDLRPNLARPPHKIRKVLLRHPTLMPDLIRILLLALQFLHIALKAHAQIVSWILERPAHLGGDTRGVGVRVVEG